MSPNQLIECNEEWVKKILDRQGDDFFEKLAQGQTPPFLWIGCSDSRVPPSVITNRLPGEIFVHRNIANMVVPDDKNLFSVVYYGVKHLGIKHIIVCGHYGCGGVAAAMEDEDFGFLNHWLSNIKDVYKMHQLELDSIDEKSKRFDRFVELNVIEQVRKLTKVSFLQEEMSKDKLPPVQIHGWVFSLKTGLINKELRDPLN